MATVLSETNATDSVRDICGIDLKERHNLDAEMAAMVEGIEKKIRIFAKFRTPVRHR